MINVNPTTLTVEAAKLRIRANQPNLHSWERENLCAQADQKMAAVHSFYAEMGESSQPYDFSNILTEVRLTPRQRLLLTAAAVAFGIGVGFGLCLLFS